MSNIFDMEGGVGFREKSSALTVASLVVLYGGYFIWAALAPRSQGETVNVLILVAFLMVLTTIVGHVAMAILDGRQARERIDERDRIVIWRAGRNAYHVLLAAVWVAPALYLLHVGPITWANGFMGALLAGELANYGSRLYYYRRGV